MPFESPQSTPSSQCPSSSSNGSQTSVGTSEGDSLLQSSEFPESLFELEDHPIDDFPKLKVGQNTQKYTCM